MAVELGYDYFASALTISPHKNSQVINSVGIEVQKVYATKYLPSDFKKNDGYRRSVEMCEEYDIVNVIVAVSLQQKSKALI